MKLQVNPDACSGCRLCRQVCAIEKALDTNPRRARLRVEARFPIPGKYFPIVCDQCGDCAEACPVEAIVLDGKGVLFVDDDTCTMCGLCVEACPTGVMVWFDESAAPAKCDLCFACTEVCNTGALIKVV